MPGHSSTKLLLMVGALVVLAGGFSAGWFARGSRAAVETNASDVQSGASPATANSTLSMVNTIMRSGGNEVEIPFANVIEVASGHRLLPVIPEDPVHAAAVELIATALDATLAEMNGKNSPVKGLRRINEASSFFEESLRRQIDGHPDFECGFPHSAAGKMQRSGYPDLRIHHPGSGKVFYLDPKLFQATSRASTLRTFYFTSDPDTLKVGENASHFLVGIEHDGADGEWKFTAWDLVDLSRLKVRLKAEFQASNRDLYAKELILRSSTQTPSTP